MTTPQRKADDARSTRPSGTHSPLTRKLRLLLVFAGIFVALFLLHLTLLNLPYYWDEAGYFIPAARDIYTDGSFIPHSTLSNAHPPLVMAYIALAWKLFGFRIAVARTAMLVVATVALTGAFRLAERVANARVAAATVLCTALYPVFFAQSSLAHLDMMVAALTMWGLVFYLPPRMLRATPQESTSPRNDATSLPSDTTTESRITPKESHETRSELRKTQSESHETQSESHETQSESHKTQNESHETQSESHETQSESHATPKESRDAMTELHDAIKESRDAAMLWGDADTARALDRPFFRRAVCIFLFALAALAKETALLVPLTLFGWELLCALAGRNERVAAAVCVERGRRSFAWSLALLLACVPLALWFAYHRARTGYTFGNPEYFRYNVESTLNLARVLETAWRRFLHVTAHMNLWALTLAGVVAMFLKPRRDGGKERPRIALPVQSLFAALILAHVVALSLVGGAVLARYMLPVLPLVVLVWVSTLWRRVPAWPLAVALVCGAFAYRTVVNPSYASPWEENLSYRDFVVLHRDAARFLAERQPDARVLTTWPATDELKNPYFGYTDRPLKVFAVENFKRETLAQAAQQASEYDAALLFTTHGGLELEEAARLVGGRVVFQEERNGQWVAVVKVSSER